MHYEHLKPKSYLKLIKKYVFSEDEQFPLMTSDDLDSVVPHSVLMAANLEFRIHFAKKKLSRRFEDVKEIKQM